MFQFATTTDKIYMIIGSLGAIGNGFSIPLFAILFGDVTNKILIFNLFTPYYNYSSQQMSIAVGINKKL